MNRIPIIVVLLWAACAVNPSCKRPATPGAETHAQVCPSGEVATSLAAGATAGLELPKYVEDKHNTLLRHKGFTCFYNHRRLTPNWVAYTLTRDELDGDFKANRSFGRDPDVRGRQASREDYTNSGYDKGHMAPRADLKWDSMAYCESFYLTNVCPQDHRMNSGSWNQLEQQVRRIAERYGMVHVVTGPIYREAHAKTIGEAHVAVPDALFKALLAHDEEGGCHAVAFVMENVGAKQSAKQCAISIDSLESLTGWDLFHRLPDTTETRVEATYQWGDWDE